MNLDNKVYWKDTKKRGRGVFAAIDIAKNEIIEICPVITLTPKESENYDQTILGQYLYEWKNPHDGAVILGYGLLYNHSYTPNAEYVRNFKNKTMTYKAVKDIKKDEEILINYNGEPENNDEIDWFEIK